MSHFADVQGDGRLSSDMLLCVEMDPASFLTATLIVAELSL